MSEKLFRWNNDKNTLLKKNRKISFEEIVLAISNNQLIDTVQNPGKEKFPDQKIFIIDINDYAYLVPFVEQKDYYFLKTIYPSRIATKLYLSNKEKNR